MFLIPIGAVLALVQDVTDQVQVLKLLMAGRWLGFRSINSLCCWNSDRI